MAKRDPEPGGLANEIVVNIDIACIKSFFLRLRGDRFETNSRDGRLIERFFGSNGVDLFNLEMMNLESS